MCGISLKSAKASTFRHGLLPAGRISETAQTVTPESVHVGEKSTDGSVCGFKVRAPVSLKGQIPDTAEKLGAECQVWYMRHTQACFCASGCQSLFFHSVSNDKSHLLCLSASDPHAGTCLVFICC